jgi:hypothetical protein
VLSNEAELLFEGQWARGISVEAGGGGVKVMRGRGEPVLCRIGAVALREESLCTRLGDACVKGDRCSRKAEPGLSFFFIS